MPGGVLRHTGPTEGRRWLACSVASRSPQEILESAARSRHFCSFPSSMPPKALIFPIPSSGAPGLTAESGNLQVSPHRLTDDAIVALNEMNFGGPRGESSLGASVPLHDSAHKILRQHAAALCQSCPTTSPKEAFEQVMHGTDYKQASCACVPLDVSLLSIREEGAEPKALQRLLGPTGFEEVERFLSDCVLPTDVGRRRVEASAVEQVYMDTGLQRSGRRMRDLVRRMARAGMLRFTLQAECEVGLFAVAKKNGRQRLVVDCRHSNLYFEEPEHTSLPTAASFSPLELGPADQLHVVQFDLKDAFYQMELPEELAHFFCLPAVRAGNVGATSVDGSRCVRTLW